MIIKFYYLVLKIGLILRYIIILFLINLMHSITYSFFIIILSSILSYFLIKFFIPTLKEKLLDRPNLRSSHVDPTPKGGGIFLYLISFIFSIKSAIFTTNYRFELIPLLVLPLALISLYDDKYNLSMKVRFVSQLLFANITIFFLNTYLIEINSSLLLILSYLLFIISGVYLINSVNFMDGIDGLIGSTFIIIFSTIALHRGVNISFIMAVIGSLLGFIIWNWNPAKIFLGDVGSITLGSIYFSIIINANNYEQSIIFFLVSLPLIADSFFTLLFRIIKGQKFTEPHKLHLYQRLTQAGISHGRVSYIYILGVLIMSFSSFINIKFMLFAAFLEILIGFWLSEKVAVAFE